MTYNLMVQVFSYETPPSVLKYTHQVFQLRFFVCTMDVAPIILFFFLQQALVTPFL